MKSKLESLGQVGQTTSSRLSEVANDRPAQAARVGLNFFPTFFNAHLQPGVEPVIQSMPYLSLTKSVRGYFLTYIFSASAHYKLHN